MMRTNSDQLRDFGLEVFFSKWEFKAKHHMTASDLESMSVGDLLGLANEKQVDEYQNLWLGYTETWGLPALRQTIANTYDKMAAENILTLAGAGEGIYAVSRCLLTSDDHAIVVTPNYQSAETVPLSICEVTGIPLLVPNGTAGNENWQVDIDAIKDAIKSNTKLISMNFPQNPTGLLLNADELEELVGLCRQHDIYLFSDEVYRGVELDLENQMPQIADVYEKGISLNVMSKAYGLPGLRIGWIACQDHDVLQKVERYKHFLSICNSAPSEALAIIALENKETILSRNRQLMLDNVIQLETLFNDFAGLIDWQRPQGGCVAFPCYTGPGDMTSFCANLLEQDGVLLLPGSIYQSELTETPQDRFRIGFGRGQVFQDGLAAMRQHFDTYYSEFKQ